LNFEIKSIIWHQFGAAIDMHENAIKPARKKFGETNWIFRILVYCFPYTFLFRSLFVAISEGFTPPPPFTLDEMDERGLLPDRIYTKQELLKYLATDERSVGQSFLQ